MERRKQRSSSYPSYSIEYCIGLVAKIYSNFGGGSYYAKREEIAEVLKVSTGHLQTQVSSANQYGLLELKTGQGYKPSKLFLSIHKPVDAYEKSKALIEVFKSPPLYSALVEKFENDILPAELPLSNILLHHHNISEGANEKAASIFIENVKFLGFLNDENVFKIENNSITEKIEETVIDEPQGIKNNVSLVRSDDRIKQNDEYSMIDDEKGKSIFDKPMPFNIPLKGKRTAQIIVPADVRDTDFDFIINFINLMKQQFVE